MDPEALSRGAAGVGSVSPDHLLPPCPDPHIPQQATFTEDQLWSSREWEGDLDPLTSEGKVSDENSILFEDIAMQMAAPPPSMWLRGRTHGPGRLPDRGLYLVPVGFS
ncbi:Hypothetical predicted protein [Marmota monax]|uniref:Uncharacterized protein n=1 Tax=Marmota monax TaxID=9995 RepID=A0A5E4CA81_MARMO|nr:Hypothetical predicted protein [Marmota monax]